MITYSVPHVSLAVPGPCSRCRRPAVFGRFPVASEVGRCPLRVWGTLLAVLAVSICLYARSAPGDEPNLRREVSQLLDTGWEASSSARTEATDQYERILQSAPVDWRVAYAFALVQIKQRRYDDAQKLIAQILKINPTDLHVWKSKVWISMLTQKYTTALVEMDRLAGLIPDVEADDDADPEFRQTVQFLGGMFGFLDHVSDGRVAEPVREQHRERVVDQLSDFLKKEFDRSYRRVAEQHAVFLEQKNRARNEAKAKGEKQKVEIRQDLARQREQADDQRDEFEQERQALIDEHREQAKQLDEEERPLVADVMRLASNASVLRREMIVLDGAALRLRGGAAREKDLARCESILQQAFRLERLSFQYGIDLSTIDRLAFGVNSRRAKLQRGRIQLQSKTNNRLNTLDKDLNTVRRNVQRIDGHLKNRKLRQPSSGSTPRVLALSAQLSALTSYVAFPVESERQRVLDLFPL